ncbi:WbqC family protein [Clostridiaceae bacterium UIB06]|uniref:WbqC family protein n=1 Tax=Clostridium thailandense TaxID=2794346 RepID=A0A949TXF6_9CLOT|nr:WbqC family protein [Clostridium thailandense]MBV7272249.1 WbqC family protein [Clostridium thailandense]MCH5137795.1 WbqC family protein [Clostridiaceae bacterium UIB06]
MSKKIAILQSNYIPWKGVFDMIYQVDTFVFLEDVQYTEHDWRNRNKIITKDGIKWITVPVNHSNRSKQKICEAEINGKINWQRKHYNSFELNYAKAPYFKEYRWILEKLYKHKIWNGISDFNIYAIKLIANELGIETEFINSVNLNIDGSKDDKIIDICKKLNSTHYLSGPAAKKYIVTQKFEENNIKLEYIKYEYPRYNQLYGEFNHFVTVLDLIFNCGSNAPYYIWGWKKNKGEVKYDTI